MWLWRPVCGQLLLKTRMYTRHLFGRLGFLLGNVILVDLGRSEQKLLGCYKPSRLNILNKSILGTMPKRDTQGGWGIPQGGLPTGSYGGTPLGDPFWESLGRGPWNGSPGGPRRGFPRGTSGDPREGPPGMTRGGDPELSGIRLTARASIYRASSHRQARTITEFCCYTDHLC